jgi:hypothetical protein
MLMLLRDDVVALIVLDRAVLCNEFNGVASGGFVDLPDALG